jgi:putative ABC transport system substrate-binding protein
LIDFQWADTVDQLPGIVRRLVDSRVDLIFAPSSTWVEPARQATKTIPIVFANHADPVGLGHVESLAHPGGNITGLSMVFTEIAAKELEILHEAIPQAKRIGVFWNPTTPSHEPALKAVRAGAETLGVKLYEAPTRRIEDYDGAIASILAENINSLLVMASPINYSDNASRLIQLTLKHRLPAMFGYKENVQAGGLMSYAVDVLDLYHRSAVYIDKILKGTKPADLPVEQASKYELAINLKTAKALDITLPPTVLARADEVIEE